MQNRNVSEQLLRNILLDLLQGNFDSDRALKVEDIYGKWGMAFVFEVSVYLLPMPLLVTLIMFVIFKRRKLLGVTQKFIISIMMLDICFSSTSVIRDTILKVKHLNYGFLDFHVCSWVIYSLRLQMILHATSVWLNTLMAFHHLLLISYPLKVRMCNLSPYFYSFIFAHILICCTLVLFLIAPDFQPITLVQEFRAGYPLKKIEGCIVHTKEIFGDYSLYSGSLIITFVIILYSQIIPFCLHLMISVGLVIMLQKHIRSLSVLTNNATVKRIKYVMLMKINIGLCFSFVLQELPFNILLFLQFAYHEGENTNIENLSLFHGVVTSILSISYSVGKPVNLLIYSSLSSSFKQEMGSILLKFKSLFRCEVVSRKSKRKVRRNEEKHRERQMLQ